MDNPLHGNWTKDGRSFICGNGLGTISVYGPQVDAFKYESTRIQQFFEYEVTASTENPFERLEFMPPLCGYNMAPFEVQPDRFMVKFSHVNPQLSAIDFEHNFSLAKELGRIEERYYNDKLQVSNSQPDEEANGAQQEDGDAPRQGRRPRLQ
jgi:hypothetical protein